MAPVVIHLLHAKPGAQHPNRHHSAYVVSLKTVSSRGPFEFGTTLGSVGIFCGSGNDCDVGCDVTVD